jgi:hypothetical protein
VYFHIIQALSPYLRYAARTYVLTAPPTVVVAFEILTGFLVNIVSFKTGESLFAETGDESPETPLAGHTVSGQFYGIETGQLDTAAAIEGVWFEPSRAESLRRGRLLRHTGRIAALLSTSAGVIVTEAPLARSVLLVAV